MIIADQLVKIVYGILTQIIQDNIGFESRRLLSQAVNNDGTGGAKHINVIIPLNRYSFFEELESKMLVPMQIQFNITLNEDN